MRIDAARLATDQLRYESPAPGGEPDHVELGKSGGVTGYYAYDAGHVVDAAAETFAVTSALWHVDDARVAVERASKLDGVRLVLNVPDASDAPAKVHLEIASAVLDGVRIQSGTTKVAIATVRVTNLVVMVDGDDLDVRAERVELDGIAIDTDGVPIEIARSSAGDFVYQNGTVNVSELDVAEATVAYAFTAPPAAAQAAAEPPLDLPVLDQLRGVVSTTLALAVDVPALPDPTVKQPLRVPIDAGSVSWAEIERQLSVLGDALLDFEVEGDELILELDIVPVVKLDNVTLVSWSLADATDRDLAKQKRARLRRLAQPRFPPAKAAPSNGGKKAFRLLGVDLDAIDVALGLVKAADVSAFGGSIRLDRATEVNATGSLHVAIDGASAAGSLDVQAVVRGSASKLALGPATIDRGTFALAIDRTRLELEDLSPRKLRVTLREGKVTDLQLALT